MEYVKLCDVCDFQGGSQPPKEEWSFDLKKGYVRMLQIRDFTQKEKVAPEYVKVTTKTRMCEPDDILIARYGASLGKILTGLSGAYNVAIIKTIPNTLILEKRYLYYYLKSQVFQRFLVNVGSRAAQAGFNKNDLQKLLIPKITKEEQQKTVDVLETVEMIIDGYQQQLTKLDELVKARFVEMFGDMLLNPMAWPEAALETLADIVSGITKGRKVKEQTLLEVPYMAVSNVKDGYIDWTTVKTILATEQEIEQYRLFPDDVLMTEGGDPDKVGRGAIIKEPLENCIHQNHIFRVRLDKEKILPAFFAEYLQHQKSKRYFLGCAKQTTGIASINMRQLKALPVLLPPLDLQGQFDEFVRQIERVACSIQNCLGQMETLKKALMQQYFG